MRILLDARISGRRVAGPLREAGHDVRAISEEQELEGLDDPEVLALAVAEGRILVTFDLHDFAPLVREWAEAGRSHPGCILVFGMDHSDYGLILRGLEQLFSARPAQADWTDMTDGLSRARSS